MENNLPTNLTTYLPIDQHLKAVFDKLDLLKPGEIIEVSKVAPNKPDLYIECVKQYIDCFNDVDFNSDYTKLRKLNIF